MADEEDPCARAARLRELREAIATGQAVQMARFKDNEVQYLPGNPGLLDRLIAEADVACDIATNQTTRRRFAKGIRFRPSRGSVSWRPY